MKNNLTLICLVTLLLSFLFAPGCTNDRNTTTDEEPLIVRSRLRADPGKLNPLLTTKAYALQITDILFPALLRFDPNTYELSPMLAKSRPTKTLITEGPYKGGAAYTYEILEEAKWDNAKYLKPRQQNYSVKQRLLSPNTHKK